MVGAVPHTAHLACRGRSLSDRNEVASPSNINSFWALHPQTDRGREMGVVSHGLIIHLIPSLDGSCTEFLSVSKDEGRKGGKEGEFCGEETEERSEGLDFGTRVE
mmetsp:Transcript_129/g.287  ORF Transcript_129/g.287 Transcript_129/m.287 type:complete len:105 (-) Transcript_129:286-600(-)